MTPLSERDFQTQIVELAHLYGWEDFHVRAGRTAESWRVPGSGTMAKGWPDLVLLHPSERRLLFIEVKADKGKTTPDQERVLLLLQAAMPMATVHVWRPSDWDRIEATLKRRSLAA
jgi:hypothetical protein